MNLLCDWDANHGNIKGRVVMFLFRLAAWCRALPAPWWYLTVPYLIWYELTVIWSLGIELRYKTKVGAGLALFHGQSLVVHEGSEIGEGCTLRQSTTIGAKRLPNGDQSACPVLGKGVDVGANVVILGAVRIGDGAVIGAGSVVVKDVGAGSIVAGNPARPLRED